MNWGKQARPNTASHGPWKAPVDRLTRTDSWSTGPVTTLPRGSGFGSIGGFKIGALSSLRLPSMQDIINLSAGSKKIGDVLSIIQSMNALKSAFKGSNGISALTKFVPSDIANGIMIGISGKEAASSKLGKQSDRVTNISGTRQGIAETVKAVSRLEQTVASGGTKTTISSGSDSATRSLKTPYPTDRKTGAVFIEIDGKPLSDTYLPLLQKAVVHLTHEHRMSTVSLVFNNELLRFTDDPIWDEYKPIRVSFGYPSTGVQQVGGTFYSLGPKLGFGTGGDSVGSIELVGVSEEFMMGLGQERTMWNNLADYQIVQQIAQKYGFVAAVQVTSPVWEHVAQVNQSDWDFLEDRAEQYGYQLYIEDGILHFHKPIYNDSGIRMVYFQGDDSQISGFTVWGEPLQNGNVVEGTQIDPTTGKVFGVMSSEGDDYVSQHGIGRFQDKAKSGGSNNGVKRWADIVAFGNRATTRYVYHSGRVPEILNEEAQGYSENSRWIMKGMAKVIGIEWLKARDSIELAGVGRASGMYYMTDVYHRYDRGNYTNEVMLTRTWKGGAGKSNVESRPVQLVEARE